MCPVARLAIETSGCKRNKWTDGTHTNCHELTQHKEIKGSLKGSSAEFMLHTKKNKQEIKYL